MKRLLVGTVPPNMWLSVGAVPPKKVVVGRNSPNKKLKRLLIGPVPAKKIEEVIGKNSATKNKFIGRNIATKK